MLRKTGRPSGSILLIGATAVALAAAQAAPQTAAPPVASATDPNGPPNPYQLEAGWLKMPEGRKMGQAISVDVDRDGKSIWVFDRCGGTECTGSMLNPIEKFDATGKFIRGFGDGMFNRPHGFHIDRDGNIWATDQVGGNGKGHQVFKFSPEGKVLLALGKPGVTGNGPDTFNSPTDVAVAPNGDIFVSDGHGGDTNARIVKFSRDGKFIKAWGKRGSGPGEFALNHSLAFDSTGRLFVADRANNRIEIFDQDGNFLAEWKQFGRPSGIFIDKNDMLYATDSESNHTQNPGFRRGVRIGSVKDGKVTAFIPDPTPIREGTGPGTSSWGEGVTADDAGNVFVGMNDTKTVQKFVKK
jgi:sugar lactone lactonase YvrE